MPFTSERLSEGLKQVFICMNPKAGARSGKPLVEQLSRLLEGGGFDVQVITDIEQLQESVKSAWEAGTLRTVVAAGGDGTVAMVVNITPQGVPITMLPLGTENLLAKHFKLRADAEELFEAIREGVVVSLDAGKANGRIFLLMASCGFDAEVVRRLHHQRRGHISHLSYAKPIIDSIRRYRYPKLRIYCENQGDEASAAAEKPERAIVARWVFIANLSSYAGGLRIVPDADGFDGLLDVCTFKEGSFFSSLKYLSGVMFGRHRYWSDCTMQRASKIRIESDEEVPFQLDGDPGGFLPLEIEAMPERLTMLVSPAWAEQQESQAVAQKDTSP